jgi:hypothetical protein
MRIQSIFALAAALAILAPVVASAELIPGVTIESSITRRAVSDHLNQTAEHLQVATSSDATNARLIVSAQRAYDMALKSWLRNDYVPAEDYARAADVLLATSSATGRGTSDEAYDVTGRLVASLNPASALWLNSFASDLYSRAVKARQSDPDTAALDLVRATGVARASEFATLATSGAPANEPVLPTTPAF